MKSLLNGESIEWILSESVSAGLPGGEIIKKIIIIHPLCAK